MSTAYDDATRTARDYYNSDDADNFYAEIWGGEDIHIGIYRSPEDSIREASRRTVDLLCDTLGPLDAHQTVLDLGAGYGGAGRRLVERAGCRVICLNLSEAENRRNRQINGRTGVADHIEVIDGSFDNVPLADASVDAAWSQDAILLAGDRQKVLTEVDRVLKPGGRFVFTDPMRADDCPPGVLDPILSRIHLTDLGSPGFYRDAARELGWEDRGFTDMTEQLVNHYSRVLESTERAGDRLAGKVSDDYIERMKTGLNHWIEGGKRGHLVWGVFLFIKPA